jgi:hypothetical protein
MPRVYGLKRVFKRMSEVILLLMNNSFSFSLLLPATLATHDYHEHARLSHIFTARVEGIPASSGFISIFGKPQDRHLIEGRIPHKEDFEAVIARSDKVAADIASGKRAPSPRSSPILGSRGLPQMRDQEDDSAIAFGGDESPASVMGLYTRRQSIDIQRSNSMGSGPQSSREDDRHSIRSLGSGSINNDTRSEKSGWLKGDLCVQRFMLVHANPSPTGGISQLDLRKEGYVDGIGTWRFSASAEVVCPIPRHQAEMLILVPHFSSSRTQYQSPSPRSGLYTLLLSIAPHSDILDRITPYTKRSTAYP